MYRHLFFPLAALSFTALVPTAMAQELVDSPAASLPGTCKRFDFNLAGIEVPDQVHVLVQVDEKGSPVSARSLTPSGNSSLIAEVIAVAMSCNYAPAWSEQFDAHQITYLKQTDQPMVSFFTGAVEGRLRSSLTTKADLAAFVRSKKDQWGGGDRYSNISTSFQAEEKNESCVRYHLSAHDRAAKDKGKHEFLAMQSVGRFCTHPQDKDAAVDVFYSVRHAPGFDPKDLISEGEAFLRTLRFETPR